MAGALDMYYLYYYEDIYLKQHIPIHSVLVVGYEMRDWKYMSRIVLFPEFKNISYS